VALSLEGKANQLGQMVREHLPMAMQGLAVVPLFVGFDEENALGRIFSYDVAGGPYEEYRYFSIGSGSVFARGSLKKLYRDGMTAQQAVRVCVQALYDAADDDSATGGPDLTRQIFPIIAVLDADGFSQLTDTEAGDQVRAVVEGRMESPDGPKAPVE